MFITYSADTGEIRSTISGPEESYGALLTAQGETWLFAPDVLSLDPSTSYVNVETRKIVEKQSLPVSVDRLTFNAGSEGGAVISGIPVGARISIMCGDTMQYSGVADEPDMRLTSPVAAIYQVTIVAERFLPWHCEVVAE